MADYVGLVDRDRYPEASALSDTALEDASAAVLNFTDRDFLATQVIEPRIFIPATDTSRSGDLIIDIDDTDEIIDVDGFSDSQWRAGTDGPAASYGIFTYIEIRLSRPESPLMGFTRNADVFGDPWWGQVEVTANWGWPDATVPPDVQRATLIAAYEMAGDESNLSGNLRSKTVAEVSESYVPPGFGQQAAAVSLPSRSVVLLDPWRRRTL